MGNGRGVLKSRKGRVDSEHDLVGRFNFFVTKGYERGVGRKLDLWFLNSWSANALDLAGRQQLENQR